jgi:hypothetical protein
MDRASWIRPLFVCTIALSIVQLAPHRFNVPARVQSSGGVLTVNTTADTLANDMKLSLREALGVANGSIKQSLDLGEQLQMAGCTFDAFGNITGGCGAGIVDTIVFAASLGNSAVITLYLNSPLPPINDTAATIIHGDTNNVDPIINAALIGMNKDGLTITSNDNAIYGITVISATQDGFHITGNNNIIMMSSGARANARHGIYISGAHEIIIGPLTVIANNGANGILVAGAAHNNSIENNSIYSNTQYGVEFRGAGTSFNVITRTEIYQNGGNGIAESGEALNNVWREMSIYGNGGLGINQGDEYPLTERPDPPTNFRITSVNPTTGDVSGQTGGSFGDSTITVDLYRLALDPSGFGEGKAFVGSAATDTSGNWTITDPAFNAGCYTAVVRSIANGVTFASEFARTNCAMHMPMVQR